MGRGVDVSSSQGLDALRRDWSSKAKMVDGYLKELVEGLRGPSELREAISYVLFPGGKRIRPYLLLKVAEVIQVNMGLTVRLRPFLPFAAALELIHNYSLVHDDLPAMDNDDFRRGKPTAHKVYGEGKAVLLGDEMLTLAFRVASGADAFPPDRVVRALRVLSDKAGERYLIGGQWEDIHLELSRRGAAPRELSLEVIRRIETAKTGGLMLATAQIPVVLLEPSFSLAYRLVSYAYWLGQLFQITDDLLDGDGYCLVLGVEETRRLAERAHQRCLRALSGLRGAELLRDLASFVLHRQG